MGWNWTKSLSTLETRMRGGGIMIWACIIRGSMVSPWKVLHEVKMTVDVYIAFLTVYLEPWLKKQEFTFKPTIIFMQNNDPLHSTKKTTEYLPQLGFVDLGR